VRHWLIVLLRPSAALAITPEACEFIDISALRARLEKRLAVLEARVLDAHSHARNREDLDAISFQQRQALYRCK